MTYTYIVNPAKLNAVLRQKREIMSDKKEKEPQFQLSDEPISSEIKAGELKGVLVEEQLVCQVCKKVLTWKGKK